LLVRAPGGVAAGMVVRGLTGDDLARLDFFTGMYGARRAVATVLAPDPEEVAIWSVDPLTGPQEGPWRLEDWVARWGEVTVATVRDAMALFGQADPPAVGARMPLMMVRGASRLRAAGSQAELRRAANPGDVAVARRRQPYARFFAVEEYDLRFRRFDGAMGDEVNRAVFLSGDAVTVLPYDPLRDRVLLIEQFRIGPFARGDDQPWLLEAIAGRIDPGETPEQTARREAAEEAGLELGELLPVASYYPSPGAKAEYLYSFVALTDLPDGAAGTFGVAEEAEDIRGHLISFDRVMELVGTGEINNAPLLVTVLWLQRERARLRSHSR
jgi:nudix-type nucleoside diphosphatase (YffH/AdpP family)